MQVSLKKSVYLFVKITTIFMDETKHFGSTTMELRDAGKDSVGFLFLVTEFL